MRLQHPRLLCLALTVISSAAFADEGMWTFDNPPSKLLQERYHFTPSQQWLDHVRLSSVRLNDGGSGSFVSPNGLLLTNHHVARGQLQKNSTPEHDYIKNGFYATTAAEELKSPDLEVNVLVSMENVTARVAAAIKPGATEKTALTARKAITAQIESESLKQTGLRSDVVTLYQGGEYWLYRYKKYNDVRLVFAPEQQAAFFGGDPDNFTYPRYDLDMALFRVYEDGKPLVTKDYLKFNAKGPAEGELVFVSGHPGSTQRQDTVAQLTEERDIVEPKLLAMLKHRIDVLKKYAAESPEHERQVATLIFGLENSQKAYIGRLAGLKDPAVFSKKQQEEADFRQKVTANAKWSQEYGGAWGQIEAATAKSQKMFPLSLYRRVDSQLAGIALNLVQYVAEVKKPDGERLRGFHESQLESLRYRLLSPAPVYPDMEKARLAGALEQSVAELGATDPWIEAVTNGQSPSAVASALIDHTRMADPKYRKELLDGGPAAVAASTDPLVVMARRIDPLVRELVKQQEDNVSSVIEQAGEKLGKARFDVYGKSSYPDATFTLRLSYGAAVGFPMNGTKAPYKTTFYGLYDRAASFDNSGPFYLPSRYLEGKNKLDLATPLDFVSSCDIIGGNSGSPVINKNAELIGLIFDGNIESLAGDFVYEGERNRAVSVHTAAMIEALRKLYNAGKLADELQGI